MLLAGEVIAPACLVVQRHHGTTTSITLSKRWKSAGLKVSSRLTPCASMVASERAMSSNSETIVSRMACADPARRCLAEAATVSGAEAGGVGETVAACDFGNRGVGHVGVQLGANLFKADRVQGAVRRDVAEIFLHHLQRPHAAAGSGCSILQADRRRSMRTHEFVGAAHIGGHRAMPAVDQTLRIIVRNTVQSGLHHQIGEGRQRDHVVGQPVRPAQFTNEIAELRAGWRRGPGPRRHRG